MSYQIKSTPFFRRMLSTSKKNGQLQKLKEEYERIREVNEHTIELKMRQVRLKRLFREIEEIKETAQSMVKRRRVVTDRFKSEEERRVETFVNAKELGKEYSRLNAIMLERRLETAPSSPSSISVPSDPVIKAKARIARRLSYSNEIARTNKRKLEQIAKKKPYKQDMKDSKISNDLKKMLQQRLRYGNSRSNFNMSKIPKRHAKHKIATDHAEPAAVQFINEMSQPPPQPPPLTSLTRQRPSRQLQEVPQFKHPVEEQLFPALTEAGYTDQLEQKPEWSGAVWALPMQYAYSDTPQKPVVFKTFEQLQNSKIVMTTASQADSQPSVGERARKYWHMVALIVRNRFGMITSRRNQEPLDQTNNQEFQLRNIPNDTHLPLSQLNDNIEAYYEHESDLDEVFISLQSYVGARSSPAETAEAQPDDRSAIAPPTIVQKVQKFVKVFEPYVRQVAEKEAYEAFGVQKLRSIFEHQL